MRPKKMCWIAKAGSNSSNVEPRDWDKMTLKGKENIVKRRRKTELKKITLNDIFLCENLKILKKKIIFSKYKKVK